MALFRFRWLRRFVRRNTSVIPIDKAALWKKRLSVVYMLLAWQAFGFVGYMMYTGRNDWAKYYGFKSEEEARMSPALQFAKLFNVENGKVIRLSGLRVVEEMEIGTTTKEPAETVE